MEDIVYKIDESLYKEAKSYLPELWMSRLFPSGFDCIIDESVITSQTDVSSMLDDLETMYTNKSIVYTWWTLNVLMLITITVLYLVGLVSSSLLIFAILMSCLMEYSNISSSQYRLEKNKYANFLVLKLRDSVIETARNYLLDASEERTDTYKEDATRAIDAYTNLRKSYMTLFEKVASENMTLANDHIAEVKKSEDIDVPVTVVYSQSIH